MPRNFYFSVQVVDTVNISVHPDGMRDILVQMYKLKSEVNRIEAEFESIGLSLTPEFLEFSNLIKEVEQDLGDANIYLSRFCNFVDNTINEYVDAERKIMCMVDRIPDIQSKSIDVLNPVQYLGPKKKYRKSYLFDMFRIDLKEEPCKLPKKQIFEKFTLKPGKINEGKNILIRTWSSSNN